MTIPAWSGSHDEKQAILARLREMGHAALHERLQRDEARGAVSDSWRAKLVGDHDLLDAALERLAAMRVQTLRAIEQELARPDTMATAEYLNRGDPDGLGVGAWLISLSPGGRMARSESSLRDGIAYRDLARLHHGFGRPYKAVRGFFRVLPSAPLCELPPEPHDQEAVAALLHVLCSIFEAQLTQTSTIYMKPNMGYSGMDAWADAQDACQFFSAAFATLVLAERPTADEIIALLDSGALERSGLEPTESLDRDELRERLALLPT